MIFCKSYWRRTIRTIEIRSERKNEKVLDRQDQTWYYIKVAAEQKSSGQQNKWKKFLTNEKNCDKMIKLLVHKKLIKKDLWQLNNKTTLKILMNFSDDFSKNQRTFFIRTVINKDKKLVFLCLGSTLNMRVWSWLRMNAGGVLNTCKSNEASYLIFFGTEDLMTEWRTGE